MIVGEGSNEIQRNLMAQQLVTAAAWAGEQPGQTGARRTAEPRSQPPAGTRETYN
jgi:hypothetical protein